MPPRVNRQAEPRVLAELVSLNGLVRARSMPLTQMSHDKITELLNELKHEVLSHQVFLNCFSSAVKRGEIKGLTKSSLFRTTLAYVLLVPDAKQKFLRELEKQLKSKSTPSRAPD
jgi:hypothetical protein